MAATTRVSSSPPTYIPPIVVSENGSCIPRIAKIAVPILSALTSFVFLPFLAAAALTIGTTFAVFTYFGTRTTAGPKPAEHGQIVLKDDGASIAFATKKELENFDRRLSLRVLPSFVKLSVYSGDPAQVIGVYLKNPTDPNKKQQLEQIVGLLNQIKTEASKKQPVFSNGTSIARIYFNTHEEKQQFATQHKSRFPDFAEFEIENKVDPSICIALKAPKHANRAQQMAQIKQIFDQIIAQ